MNIFLNLLLILSLLLLPLPEVQSEVEMCSDGGEYVFQITNDNCPFGVLFMEPQAADCIQASNDDESSAIVADVCGKKPYSKEEKIVQYIPEISSDPIEPGNSCKTTHSSKCSLPTQRIYKHSFLRRMSASDFEIPNEGNGSNVQAVKEQTQRMFEYMMGLGDHDIDGSLRVVMLLQKSFAIFKKFCDPFFLPTEFYEDVESAFLFMINEADTTRVKDISVEDFEIIKNHLDHCADQKNPLKFEGRKCVTYSMIQRVNKSGLLFSDFDTSNEDAFKKYDIPVEATWGAIDFVHGLCYGTFRDHINSHHLYQQALERLFTKEIMFRWKHRYVLQQQHIWNNFFSANVKNALLNMDICIQASYLSTPFLHRLERPVDQVETRGAGRKKRSAESHLLTSFESVEGYCFQSKDQADTVLNDMCGS